MSAAIARVDPSKGRIALQAPSLYADKCRAIPGSRWDPRSGSWSYPASPSIARQIAQAFSGTLKADSVFRGLLQQASATQAASGAKTAEDLPPIPCTGTQPWQHQLRAYHFAHPMAGCMLGMDMGTGKSKVTVDLVVNRGHMRTLIVCPLSVIQEWPNQFRTHGGKPVRVVPLDDRAGSVKDKTDAAKIAVAQADLAGEPVVLATNYETVWREPFATWLEKGAKLDCVVCDEIHRIQSADAKVSRFLGRLGPKVPYRLGLTGTPFSSGPLSIYGQYRFLDPGIFGTSVDRFRQRYALMGGKSGYQVMEYLNQEELQEKFYSIAFRVESRDVLDLPDETHVRRTCRLGKKAVAAYRDLEETFVAEVLDGQITVNNALTKLLRLQQMTSGFARLDDTEAEEGRVVRIDDEKQKLLADILSDLDRREPVVVFGRFIHDLDAIREVCERQGRRYMELSGRIKQTEAWRSGEADVLAVQIRAGGVGINLTRSHYCVYYSMGYSLADYAQSLARTMRPGQKHHVHYVHLVAEGTVDEKVYDALSKKQQVVDMILGSLR